MASPPRFENCPSPNHGERAPGKPIDMIILHYTGMPDADRALKWLRDPESSVSSHYFVFEDGRIAQLVDESRRAWHAGKSSWAGETDINARSIGIEIANPGHEFGYVPFPEAQIAAVIDLCRDILTRHVIPPRNILAHSDIAPARKEDPGELFPWDQLYRAGVGLWVEPVPVGGRPLLGEGDEGEAIAALKGDLEAFGYSVTRGDRFDLETEQVVTAFQRHFRPARVDGVADPSTVETLRRLIAAIAAV